MILRKTNSTLSGALGLALALGMVTPTAKAATILSGDLYFTTFRPQNNANVHKISFVYDNGPSLTLSAITDLALLDGADGIVFNPKNGNLLIGEQGGGDGAAAPGKVGQITTAGAMVNEVVAGAANGATPASVQAYGLITSPDKSILLTFPNNTAAGYTQVNVHPLTGGNFLAGGVTHGMFGEVTITTAVYTPTGIYYGTASDTNLDGGFGILTGVPASNPFTATRVAITDDVNPGVGVQGVLPTHALEYDSFTGCILASSTNLIWQLCQISGAWHITSKIDTALGIPGKLAANPSDASGLGNWDQVKADGHGHFFVANNNGRYLFLDYSNGSHLIGNPAFAQAGLLITDLDDFAGSFVQGIGCPATQGFWHKASRWPNVTVLIDGITGITYNGATDHSMVIGGMPYSQTQLDALLPGGSLHSGGYVNALSQLIAAVLNLAAGAQTGTPDLIDPAIAAMNTALSGVTFVTGSGTKADPYKLGTLLPSLQATLAGFDTTLNTYNTSATTWGCVEGSGLTLGGK